MIAKRKDSPVTVRFPREVLDRVTVVARSNGRSRNTEIVYRLAESLKGCRAKRAKA